MSITPLIDTEDACFDLNASRPIAKGDLKWRDALLVAHRVNSNRLLTFRCLHYTIEGVKFLLRKWPLLDSETMKEERIAQEEGGIYVSKFTLNEPDRKVFEAGYEESEVDLRVEFQLLPDGKWYVVDCYTGWYGYDLPIAELKQTIQQVKEENAAFKEIHP